MSFNPKQYNNSNYLFEPDDTWTELDDFHVARILGSKDHPVISSLSDDERKDEKLAVARIRKWWYDQTSNPDHEFHLPQRSKKSKDFKRIMSEIEIPDQVIATDGTILPKIKLDDPKVKDFKFNPHSKLSLTEQYYKNKKPEIFKTNDLSTFEKSLVLSAPLYGKGLLYPDAKHEEEVQGYYDSLNNGELPTFSQQYHYDMRGDDPATVWEQTLLDGVGGLDGSREQHDHLAGNKKLYEQIGDSKAHNGYHLIKDETPEMHPIKNSANRNIDEYNYGEVVPVKIGKNLELKDEKQIIDHLTKDTSGMTREELNQHSAISGEIYRSGYRLYNQETYMAEDPVMPNGNLFMEPDHNKNPEKWKIWNDYNSTRSLGDVILEFTNEPSKLLPYISSGYEYSELYRVWQASESLRAGGDISDEDALLIYEYILKNQSKQNNTTFWGSVGETVAHMIPFGLEIASSFGIAGYANQIGKEVVGSIMSKTVREAIEKKLGKTIRKKGVLTYGKVIDETLKVTSANILMNEGIKTFTTDKDGNRSWVSKVDKTTMQYMLPNFNIDPATSEIYIANEGLDEDTAKKFARTREHVESLSERTGYYIIGPAFKWVRKTQVADMIYKSALIQAIIKKNPLKTFPGTEVQWKNNINQYLRSAGYDGILEEMLEEYPMGEGMRHMTHVLAENGFLDPELARGDFEWTNPTAEEFMQMLVSFTIPAVGNVTLQGASTYYENEKFNKSEAGRTINKARKENDAEFNSAIKEGKELQKQMEDRDNPDFIGPEEGSENLTKKLKKSKERITNSANKAQALNMATALIKQNPNTFDNVGLLDIVDKTMSITIEKLKAQGHDISKIKQWIEGEGIPYDELSETDVIDIFGSTAWKELEGHYKVAVKLFTGANADTVLEEIYGMAYKNMGSAERKIWDDYYKTLEVSQTGGRTSQEYFEHEGKNYYYNKEIGKYKGYTGQVRLMLDNLVKDAGRMIGLFQDELDPKIRRYYQKAGLLKNIGVKTQEDIKREIDEQKNTDSFQAIKRSKENVKEKVELAEVVGDPRVEGNSVFVENTNGEEGEVLFVPLTEFGNPEELISRFETLAEDDPQPGRQIKQPVEAEYYKGKLVLTDGANRYTQAYKNKDTHIPVVVAPGDKTGPDLNYKGNHRPSEDGPQAHNMIGEDSFAPKDILDAPFHYTSASPYSFRDNNEDDAGRRLGNEAYQETLEFVKLLKENQGNPDKIVTIYRYSPENELNPGDWITPSYSYATQHGLIMGDDYEENVWMHKVKLKDIRWAGDALEEWGYHPEIPLDQVSYQAKLRQGDFYDKAERLVKEKFGGKMDRERVEKWFEGKISKSEYNILEIPEFLLNHELHHDDPNVYKNDLLEWIQRRGTKITIKSYGKSLAHLNLGYVTLDSKNQVNPENVYRSYYFKKSEFSGGMGLSDDATIDVKFPAQILHKAFLMNEELTVEDLKSEDMYWAGNDKTLSDALQEIQILQKLMKTGAVSFEDIAENNIFRLVAEHKVDFSPDADGVDIMWNLELNKMIDNGMLSKLAPYSSIRLGGDDVIEYGVFTVHTPNYEKKMDLDYENHGLGKNIAHVRYTIRKIADKNGNLKRILFIEELQSDYEQQVGSDISKFKGVEKFQEKQGFEPGKFDIQQTPYRNMAWVSLALKSIMKTAGQMNVDRIQFATAEEIALQNYAWDYASEVKWIAPAEKQWGSEIYDPANWTIRKLDTDDGRSVEWAVEPKEDLAREYPSLASWANNASTIVRNVKGENVEPRDVFQVFVFDLLLPAQKTHGPKYEVWAYDKDGKETEHKNLTEMQLSQLGSDIANKIKNNEGQTTIKYVDTKDLFQYKNPFKLRNAFNNLYLGDGMASWERMYIDLGILDNEAYNLTAVLDVQDFNRGIKETLLNTKNEDQLMYDNTNLLSNLIEGLEIINEEFKRLDPESKIKINHEYGATKFEPGTAVFEQDTYVGGLNAWTKSWLHKLGVDSQLELQSKIDQLKEIQSTAGKGVIPYYIKYKDKRGNNVSGMLLLEDYGINLGYVHFMEMSEGFYSNMILSTGQEYGSFRNPEKKDGDLFMNSWIDIDYNTQRAIEGGVQGANNLVKEYTGDYQNIPAGFLINSVKAPEGEQLLATKSHYANVYTKRIPSDLKKLQKLIPFEFQNDFVVIDERRSELKGAKSIGEAKQIEKAYSIFLDNVAYQDGYGPEPFQALNLDIGFLSRQFMQLVSNNAIDTQKETSVRQLIMAFYPHIFEQIKKGSEEFDNTGRSDQWDDMIREVKDIFTIEWTGEEFQLNMKLPTQGYDNTTQRAINTLVSEWGFFESDPDYTGDYPDMDSEDLMWSNGMPDPENSVEGQSMHYADEQAVMINDEIMIGLSAFRPGDLGIERPTNKKTPEGKKTLAYERNPRINIEVDKELRDIIWNTNLPSFQLNVNKDKIMNSEDIFIDDASAWQWWLHRIQDEMIRMKVVQEEIGMIPDELDAYMKHELLPGKTAEKIDLFRKNTISPFIKRMKELGIGIQELGDYLYMKHAQERNKHILEKHGKENGSGKTEKQIKDYFAMISPEKLKLYEEFAEQEDDGSGIAPGVYAIAEETLEMLYMNGIISQDSFDEMQDMYQYYVPLKGLGGKKGSMFMGQGRKYTVTGSGIIGAKGRESSADNPLVQIFADRESAISLIEKNNVLKAFYNLVEKYPTNLWSKPRGKRVMPVYKKLPSGEETVSDTFDEEGNTLFMPLDQNLRGNQIEVRIDGKAKIIEIKDDLLLASLRGPNKNSSKGLELIYKGFSVFNTFFRSVNTSLRLKFIITNFQRDAQTAGINMTESLGFKSILNVYKNLGSSIRGIYRASRGKKEKTGFNYIYFKDLTKLTRTWILANIDKEKIDPKDVPSGVMEEIESLGGVKPGDVMEFGLGQDAEMVYNKKTKTSTQKINYYFIPEDLKKLALTGKAKPRVQERAGGWEYWYNQFKLNGGKVGWMDQMTVEDKLADLEKQISILEGKGKTKQIFAQMGQFVEDVNMSVENGIRLMVFREMVEQGNSKEKSAQFAKNLTVNFNKKGTWGAFFNRLWVFSNAGIQGSAKLLYSYAKNPKAKKMLNGLVIAGFFQSLINRLLAPDEWDNKVDDYQKDNMFLLTIPGTEKYGSMKVGYGLNAFWSTGVILEDILAGQEWYQELLGLEAGSGTTFERGFKRFLKAVDQGFNPIGSMNMFTPTILQPIAQINKTHESGHGGVNWMGSPIYKTSFPGQPDLFQHESYFKGVYPTSRDATRALYEATSNEKGFGGVDLNPEKIDHFMRAYGGGLTKDFMDATNFAYEGIKNGELVAPDNYPLLDVFVQEGHGWDQQSTFFEIYDRSKVYAYGKQEIMRFYRTGAGAVEKGTLDKKVYKQRVRAFRKNQKELTGEDIMMNPYNPKQGEGKKVKAKPVDSGSKKSYLDYLD